MYAVVHTIGNQVMSVRGYETRDEACDYVLRIVRSYNAMGYGAAYRERDDGCRGILHTEDDHGCDLREVMEVMEMEVE